MPTWKPITGYEGRYDVSSDGRVRSKLNGKTHNLKSAINSAGYLTVSLYDGSKPKRPKSHSVHQLVAREFIGVCPGEHQVDHINGDRTNNHASNLRYVTAQGNIDAQVKQGTRPCIYRGESHVNAKLTNEQVQAMRTLHEQGYTYSAIARCFGVSLKTSQNVVKRETYASVEPRTLASKAIAELGR